jgi:DNA-binding SARP family transcriptional activator
MDFRVLGPVEARDADRVLALGGPRQRALVALLLLHANEPVSAERVALGLWGEEAPASAGNAVHVYVSRLRRALGDADRLVTTTAGYRLRLEPGELDADRFERLVTDGRGALGCGDAPRARELLGAALGLWRGPALAEVAGVPFAQAESTRLEEQRLAAVEARVEADLMAGRHAELVGELQRLVAEQPLRERMHGLLMVALYRSGTSWWCSAPWRRTP